MIDGPEMGDDHPYGRPLMPAMALTAMSSTTNTRLRLSIESRLYPGKKPST